jgi:hypothetical protein
MSVQTETCSIEQAGSAVYIVCGSQRRRIDNGRIDEGITGLPDLIDHPHASFSEALAIISRSVTGLTREDADKWIDSEVDAYVPRMGAENRPDPKEH